MGKKYTTTAQTVTAIATQELEFLVEAWDGIKPSRMAGTKRVSVVAKATAERRPSEGKRPQVVANVEMSWEDIDDISLSVGNWGLVLQDGTVIHECEYRPRLGRVVGTVQGMWGCAKYAHLPIYEFDVVTRRARI